MSINQKINYDIIIEWNTTQQYKELWIHTTTWMNLENLMKNESSQTQKSTYSVIPFV